MPTMGKNHLGPVLKHKIPGPRAQERFWLVGLGLAWEFTLLKDGRWCSWQWTAFGVLLAASQTSTSQTWLWSRIRRWSQSQILRLCLWRWDSVPMGGTWGSLLFIGKSLLLLLLFISCMILFGFPTNFRFTEMLHEPEFPCTPHPASPDANSLHNLFFKFIYFERERERERERIPSRLHAVSAEPDTGLHPTNHEIMT